MKETKTYAGCYVKWTCCEECEWYANPNLSFPLSEMDKLRNICPDCGNPTKRSVGRFIIEEVEAWFTSTRKYINFIKKEVLTAYENPTKPKEIG